MLDTEGDTVRERNAPIDAIEERDIVTEGVIEGEFEELTLRESWLLSEGLADDERDAGIDWVRPGEREDDTETFALIERAGDVDPDMENDELGERVGDGVTVAHEVRDRGPEGDADTDTENDPESVDVPLTVIDGETDTDGSSGEGVGLEVVDAREDKLTDNEPDSLGVADALPEIETLADRVILADGDTIPENEARLAVEDDEKDTANDTLVVGEKVPNATEAEIVDVTETDPVRLGSGDTDDDDDCGSVTVTAALTVSVPVPTSLRDTCEDSDIAAVCDGELDTDGLPDEVPLTDDDLDADGEWAVERLARSVRALVAEALALFDSLALVDSEIALVRDAITEIDSVGLNEGARDRETEVLAVLDRDTDPEGLGEADTHIEAEGVSVTTETVGQDVTEALLCAVGVGMSGEPVALSLCSGLLEREALGVSETEIAAVNDVVRAAEEEEDAYAVTVAEGRDESVMLTDADVDRDANDERELDTDTVCEDDIWLLSVIESETSDEREPDTDAVADLLRAGERL